jgi:acetyltransferase-like isoleucine patch superfamily enzyme
MLKLKRIYFSFQTFFWSYYARRKLKSCGLGLRVNYPSTFARNTTVGEDCHFNGISIVGKGSVSIGDHFHSGSGILIITQNHDYFSPKALPYNETGIAKKVIIGKNVWIGSRVIILPGTTIEDGVVVQAGSVLFGYIPKCAVVAGNPWSILKYRDIKKYDCLEKQGIYVGWTNRKYSEK